MSGTSDLPLLRQGVASGLGAHQILLSDSEQRTITCAEESIECCEIHRYF